MNDNAAAAAAATSEIGVTPPASFAPGIYTNYSRVSLENLFLRPFQNVRVRNLESGVPKSWRGPPPPKGTVILARRCQVTYVSLGESLTVDKDPIPRWNLGDESITSRRKIDYSTSLLPEVENPDDTQFVFLPELTNGSAVIDWPKRVYKKRLGAKVRGSVESATNTSTQSSGGQSSSHTSAKYLVQASVSGEKNFRKRIGHPDDSEESIRPAKMVGKKSGRALQLEEGLERTDNGMKQSSWPEVQMINQKNYYTEYMKRDDQILPLRLQAEANRDKMIRNAKDRDRALARTGNTDVPGPVLEEGEYGAEEGSTDDFESSKIIVIHLGSQNMRIGLASDALPKTLSMAVALKSSINTESEQYDIRPRREEASLDEKQFGEEFSKKFVKQCNDLKIDMRANKRKVLPNSKELVINYNRRTPPETIPEHNDPVRIEWTDCKSDTIFSGQAAQRIPDDSDPKFRLSWPIQHGWLNERDYRTKEQLQDVLTYVIEEAIRNELGLDHSQEWKQFSCMFIIPDLYDKTYVEELVHIAMRNLEFARVGFFQESLAASFGAGYTTACIVDVGAQKTSVCCVEDGMCIEDSRINLKYGGYDVTETFVKMMLHDHFPYQEINLMKRYDFLLAEELKIKFCTMNQSDISVQLYNFHLRLPSESTRKYQFKTYDEVILAPMGIYDPSIFDNSTKLVHRHSLVDRSYNVYDPDMPDDPVSAGQVAILTSIKPSLGINATLSSNGEVSTPAKEKPQPFNLLSRIDSDALGHNGTPGTSTAGSPAPEGANTPNPFGHANGGSPGPSNVFQFGGGSPAPPSNMFVRSPKDLAIERDSILPITPLDTAILTSIQHAAKGDEKKLRDLIGGIMVIGGGAKTPGFGPFLEERLKLKRPDLAEKVLVGTSPREMDGQVVAWKGAAVFSKLNSTSDAWITQLEYERLGTRAIYGRVSWQF